MFNVFREFFCGSPARTINALNVRIDDLNLELSLLKEDHREATSDLENLRKERYQSYYNDSVSVDFSAFKVVAIERSINPTTSVPYTVLGLRVSEDSFQLDEWYLNISDDAHEKLLAEFNSLKKYRNYCDENEAKDEAPQQNKDNESQKGDDDVSSDSEA